MLNLLTWRIQIRQLENTFYLTLLFLILVKNNKETCGSFLCCCCYGEFRWIFRLSKTGENERDWINDVKINGSSRDQVSNLYFLIHKPVRSLLRNLPFFVFSFPLFRFFFPHFSFLTCDRNWLNQPRILHEHISLTLKTLIRCDGRKRTDQKTTTTLKLFFCQGMKAFCWLN